NRCSNDVLLKQSFAAASKRAAMPCRAADCGQPSIPRATDATKPPRCALARHQGRSVSTPPHAAHAPPLPSSMPPSCRALPSPFASPKGVPPSHSSPLPSPSRAAPPQCQNGAAAPPLPPPLELTVEPLPPVPLGPN